MALLIDAAYELFRFLLRPWVDVAQKTVQRERAGSDQVGRILDGFWRHSIHLDHHSSGWSPEGGVREAVPKSADLRLRHHRFRGAVLLKPRIAFHRAVVLPYGIDLEQNLYAPTIELRIAAVRRVAYRTGDSGFLSPELAAGIRRGKGVRRDWSPRR